MVAEKYNLARGLGDNERIKKILVSKKRVIPSKREIL